MLLPKGRYIFPFELALWFGRSQAERQYILLHVRKVTGKTLRSPIPLDRALLKDIVSHLLTERGLMTMNYMVGDIVYRELNLPEPTYMANEVRKRNSWNKYNTRNLGSWANERLAKYAAKNAPGITLDAEPRRGESGGHRPTNSGSDSSPGEHEPKP